MTEDTQGKVVNAYKIAMRGDFDHARMILEESLYEDPENIEAWLLLADLAESQDEARQCYQMVLEINPENWVAQQRLKLLLSQEISHNEGVKSSFEQVDNQEEFLDLGVSSDEEDLESDHDSLSVKETLNNAFNAHRKFFIRVGAGAVVLLLLMVFGWVASIAFIAWRMGYLIIGG